MPVSSIFEPPFARHPELLLEIRMAHFTWGERSIPHHRTTGDVMRGYRQMWMLCFDSADFNECTQ
jgi:hypothetical protein